MGLFLPVGPAGRVIPLLLEASHATRGAPASPDPTWHPIADGHFLLGFRGTEHHQTDIDMLGWAGWGGMQPHSLAGPALPLPAAPSQPASPRHTQQAAAGVGTEERTGD